MATLRHANEFVRIVGHHEDYNMNEDAELVSLFMEDDLKHHDLSRFNEPSYPMRCIRSDDEDRPANPMPNNLPQLSMNERLRLRRKHEEAMDIDQIYDDQIPSHDTPKRNLRLPSMIISPKDIDCMTFMMDDSDALSEDLEDEAFSFDHNAQTISSLRKKRRSSYPDHDTM